jgi:hypothetical protein
MPHFRRTAALIAAAALAAPAAAQAGEAHSPSPRIVVSSIAKPLPPAKAKRLQDRIARGGRLPKGPRLSSTRGLEKVRSPHAVAPGPASGAELLAANAGPAHSAAKLFGFHGTYASKRTPIVQWINYTYSRVIPNLGGTFIAPAVYEVAHGGHTPNGCGATYNGIYCGGLNTIGFSSLYAQSAFNNIGDSAFAGLLAHEFGHGAQQWLRLNDGLMRYVHYSEGFADCMAGGWLAQMYNWGYVDSVGRGDWREYLDVLTQLSDTTTTLDNHGRPEWRHAAATYGWNYGMRGCAAWGRQLVNS